VNYVNGKRGKNAKKVKVRSPGPGRQQEREHDGVGKLSRMPETSHELLI
jgi:hypothetical protein